MSSTATSQRAQTAHLSPQEKAVQALCKKLLKDRVIRGFYLERRFVQEIDQYRDVVSLQRQEKKVEKLIIDIAERLRLFYAQTDKWIGITYGPLIGLDFPLASLQTCLWVELDGLAFGEYFFCVKGIRFRQREVIVKLMMVRHLDDEISTFTRQMMDDMQYGEHPDLKTELITPTADDLRLFGDPSLMDKDTVAATDSATVTARGIAPASARVRAAAAKQIEFEDFLEIVRQWGTSIKHSVFHFMKHDVNKQNIKELLRFLILLLFSLLSGAVVFVKFLGIFTLRFMFEFSRLTHVMTPILFKIIEALSKIVGGFYILLAMIWRDTIGSRFGRSEPIEKRDFERLEYNRPMYRAIKYDVEKKVRKKIE